MKEVMLSPIDAKIVKGKLAGKTSKQIAKEVMPEQPNGDVLVRQRLRKLTLRDAVKAELMRDGLTLADIMAPVKKALKAKTRHRSYQKEVIKEGNKTIERNKEVVISEEDNLPLQLSAHDRAVKLLGIDKMHESDSSEAPLSEDELKALAESSDEVELTRLVFKKSS